MAKKLIRFDWAMKKMLRHKANFGILEGFLSELLEEEIKIKQILESESNKETEDDKSNRVDILVENSKGELVIIEVQNSKEYDYFHRMLFGAAKAITEHIKEGQAYAEVKKVIAITIAYFDLGQGKDYVYHGTTVFKGIHKHDILTLADKQIELYKKNNIHEIYPEFWVIKVGKFGNRVKDKLDEWIYFFKNAEIKADFSAKGLKEASERLDEMKLNEKDAKEYKRYLKGLRDIASQQHTKMADAQDLINKGKEDKEIEVVLEMHKDGVSTKTIAKYLKITEERIAQILENQRNK
ncbi:MAG TPA: Rpn family recombination-promoting nuclease/putative transposase [Saprospiraceae bacterium]|nr:Rpn family recombination-promoting nuclease/putative transposase [Saprospiraceae bacterium]HRK82633.1 Rpn family recombination-promoting nuclease/putative transposase [Saprospiraceae bacterium]